MSNIFYNKSYISVDQVEKEDVLYLLGTADEMKKLVETEGASNDLYGKAIAALFYEPSSRTFSSFIIAMQRLGGMIIPLQGMKYSSVAKGESLQDTIRTFSSFADVIVMRHPEIESAKIAAQYSSVPFINAGNGTGEHPTQALLDAYTIKSHFDSFDGLHVGMIGDMVNGRTVHSLSKLLVKLGVKKFYWVSPKILKMPKEIKDKVSSAGGEIVETEQLDEVISDLDIMYVTRVQKERFKDPAEYEELKHVYVITPETLKKAKEKMFIMHPLPRVGEIAYEVDEDSRAIYIREQIKNGVYIRMALLKLILK